MTILITFLLFFMLSNFHSFKLVDVKKFEEKILINALLNSITKEFTTYDILKKEMSNNSQSQVETNYLSLLPKQEKPDWPFFKQI